MEAACCFTRYRKREHSTSSRKFNCNKSEQFFWRQRCWTIVRISCIIRNSIPLKFRHSFFFFWMFSRYFLLSIPYFIRLFDNCILQIVGFSYWLAAPSYAFSRSLRLAQKVFTILPVNIVRANMIHSAIELVHLHTNSLLFTIMQKLIRSTIELVHNLQHMKMKRSDGKKQSRTWTEVQFHLRR